MGESIKTYTDQIDFWHWGELFTLSNLVDQERGVGCGVWGKIKQPHPKRGRHSYIYVWGSPHPLSHPLHPFHSARHYCLELVISEKSKLECNKALQAKFNINNRYCNSIYTDVQAIVSNVDERSISLIFTPPMELLTVILLMTATHLTQYFYVLLEKNWQLS